MNCLERHINRSTPSTSFPPPFLAAIARPDSGGGGDFRCWHSSHRGRGTTAAACAEEKPSILSGWGGGLRCRWASSPRRTAGHDGTAWGETAHTGPTTSEEASSAIHGFRTIFFRARAAITLMPPKCMQCQTQLARFPRDCGEEQDVQKSRVRKRPRRSTPRRFRVLRGIVENGMKAVASYRSPG